MKIKKITVTKDDIRKGKPHDPCNCPIARAVKRTCRTKDVEIDDSARVGKANFELPRHAEKFIVRFDRGDCVRPFSFWLEA